MRNATVVTAVVVVVAMLAGTAGAAETLYEGFGYGAVALDGVGGSEKGFLAGSKWMNSTEVFAGAPSCDGTGTSLAYPSDPDITFTTTGSKICSGGTGGYSDRQLAFSLTAGNTYYTSVLIEKNNDYTTSVAFDTGGTQYNYYFGIGGNYEGFVLVGSDVEYTGTALTTGKTYFVISKIVVGTDSSTAYLKIYSDSDDVPTSEPAWDINATGTAVDLTYMGVTVRGSGSDNLDEIRMGTSWGDVAVPEPATMVLLGIGGIGVLLRRRRK